MHVGVASVSFGDLLEIRERQLELLVEANARHGSAEKGFEVKRVRGKDHGGVTLGFRPEFQLDLRQGKIRNELKSNFLNLRLHSVQVVRQF